MKIIMRLISLFVFANAAIAAPAPLILSGTEDGAKWNLQNVESGSSTTLKGIVQNGNELIAVGNGNAPIFKSSDEGKTWALTSLTGSPTLNAIAASSKSLVAVGEDSTILVSTDNGKNWSKPSVLPNELTKNKVNINAISFNGNHFILIGHHTPSGYPGQFSRLVIAMSSDHGNSWRLVTPETFKWVDVQSIYSIHWDGTQWVIPGYRSPSSTGWRFEGFLLTSPDGLEWAFQTLPENLFEITNFASNENEWLVYGNRRHGNRTYDRTYIFKSLDKGKTWAVAENPFPYEADLISKLNWNGKVWIAVGRAYREREGSDTFGPYPVIFTSKDGLNNWVKQPLPAAAVEDAIYGNFLKDVIWTGSRWIAVGEYNKWPKPEPGCKNYLGKWFGTLSQGIYITPLKIEKVSRSKTSDDYIVSGSIHYNPQRGDVTIALTGTCKEEDGKAILNLEVEVDYFNSRSRLTATKAFESNELEVTSSWLPVTARQSVNLTGTLQRQVL